MAVSLQRGLTLTKTQQFSPNDPAPEPEFSLPITPPPSQNHQDPEPIRHILYGSKRAIHRTIDILHVKRYAERFEWTQPLPTQTPGEYMSTLSRRIRIQ